MIRIECDTCNGWIPGYARVFNSSISLYCNKCGAKETVPPLQVNKIVRPKAQGEIQSGAYYTRKPLELTNFHFYCHDCFDRDHVWLIPTKHGIEINCVCGESSTTIPVR